MHTNRTSTHIIQRQRKQHQQEYLELDPLTDMPTRRIYTGIDKLLMAAMMDESATHMMAFNNIPAGYLPCSRSSGYLSSGAADTYNQIVRAPSNKSELELYRLLEHANLLGYFETFLQFGGDDVRQLSEADEDEFIEIMGLVGMTQKPLHVRRLQKALIEWRANKSLEFESSFRLGLSDSVIANNDGQLAIDETALRNTSAALTESGSIHQSWLPTAAAAAAAVVVAAATTTATASTTTTIGPIGQRPEELRQCLQPREVLVGAPKRPRLMDNLHRTPTTPGQSTRLDLTQSSYGENRTSSPIDRDQRKNTSDSGESEDRLIEVLDSSQSDIEPDESATKAARRCSPNTVGYSHNKYGRYKASLLRSPTARSSQN